MDDDKRGHRGVWSDLFMEVDRVSAHKRASLPKLARQITASERPDVIGIAHRERQFLVRSAGWVEVREADREARKRSGLREVAINGQVHRRADALVRNADETRRNPRDAVEMIKQ